MVGSRIDICYWGDRVYYLSPIQYTETTTFAVTLAPEFGARNLNIFKQKHGTKLLTSGWWGVASHANYLGDLMLSLGMCAVVGFNTLFGYGYFLAFIILLIHREWRDNRHCAAKYGDDWVEYRKKVPYRIIPGIY